MSYPSLWRVVGVALTIALLANVLLWALTDRDAAFANVVAVASGVAAVVLVLARFLARHFMGEAFLLSMTVWIANLIEYATFDPARWESQVRQCGFYGAFAILSLGAYLATRTVPVDDQ